MRLDLEPAQHNQDQAEQRGTHDIAQIVAQSDGIMLSESPAVSPSVVARILIAQKPSVTAGTFDSVCIGLSVFIRGFLKIHAKRKEGMEAGFAAAIFECRPG